jgi:hypothetical protein
MLQDQLKYASALAANITVAPDATWNEMTETAHLNEISVPRHKLQNMLHTLVEKAYSIMDHDILFDRREDVFVGRKDGIATFDRPNSIQDLPNGTKVGYSYLTANPCFTKERDGLVNLFKHDIAMQDRFTLPYLVDNEPAWNFPEIQRYVSVVDDFKSTLVCLVYWLSGMPPRGTEFTGTLICNTSQRRRNLLCAQGDLIMEHTYTKSESSSGFGRPVMRLPAHQLQRLLEEYIVVVKPMYDAFILLLRGETANTTTEYHSLLWTLDGHAMTTAELSKCLRRLSMEHLGHSIALRPWRQLMIQFATYILPLEIRNLPLTTYVTTAQASHGQAARDKNYNRQAGLTFEQVCSRQFGEFRRVSLAWVEAFGFPHPTLRSCVTDGTTSSSMPVVPSLIRVGGGSASAPGAASNGGSVPLTPTTDDTAPFEYHPFAGTTTGGSDEEGEDGRMTMALPSHGGASGPNGSPRRGVGVTRTPKKRRSAAVAAGPSAAAATRSARSRGRTMVNGGGVPGMA